MNDLNPGVIPFQSRETHASKVVQDFYQALSPLDLGWVVFFCSVSYELDSLADELGRLFKGVPIIGCTTAGEIGPSGYLTQSFVGAGFSADSFRTAIALLDLSSESLLLGRRTEVSALLDQLNTAQPVDLEHCFAFMLIDGLSRSEEKVAHSLQQELGTVPLVGGSAGDDQRLEKTHVYSEGRFHTNALVLALVETNYRFSVFMHQHFVTSEQRMVVTAARPETRTVLEINGLPATEEYARMIGLTVADLNSEVFSRCPVVVRIAGLDFVRSIQKVNRDGSLTFFCAIDEGVVLRTARVNDLTNSTINIFSQLEQEVGKPELTLVCECVLRRNEVKNNDLMADIECIYLNHQVVGFGSYGEQFRGIHINQTLTGVVLSPIKEGRDV